MGSETVWFDLENTPHVLFLEPIIRRLRKQGIDVAVTAKPQSQTIELAEARGLDCVPVGEGNVRGRVRKVIYGLGRAVMLGAWAARQGRPRLLVSSSRSASVAARWMGIPAIGLLDYEHSEHRPFSLGCRPVFLPDLLRGAVLPAPLRRVASYFEGLKENLYLDVAGVDRSSSRLMLELASDDFVVVARPPALHAHYANEVDESARLWARIVREFHDERGAILYLMPRDAEQREWLDQEFSFQDRAHVLQEVKDGPTLVAAADLVLSGGGTMNREAAVLGIPAWSVFTGKPPHLDECLAKEGRLRWVRNDEEYALAKAAGIPGLLPRRGPYPGGIAQIVEAIVANLERRPVVVGAGAEAGALS
jgi:predicted glycosyltransferase